MKEGWGRVRDERKASETKSKTFPWMDGWIREWIKLL